MFMDNNDTLKNIGLQFFADGGSEGSDGAGGSEGDEEGGKGNQGTGNQSGKTFSQEDVNRLLKAEKESAKKALLKELGVEDAKSAKEGLAKYKEILDKDKTDAQKAQESLQTEQKAKTEAEQRALVAEAKVEVLTAGGKPEYLEDIMTLALKRVSDEKDLATVVKEMKEDSKYSTFFGDGASSGDKNTGGGSGFKKSGGQDKAGALGTRLGQQVAASNSKENPYFKN